MDEISTSFCFICLLHLANEEGLKLEGGTRNEDETSDELVGSLWNLKVGSRPSKMKCTHAITLQVSMDPNAMKGS
jgi:condensin complex subunit 2